MRRIILISTVMFIFLNCMECLPVSSVTVKVGDETETKVIPKWKASHITEITIEVDESDNNEDDVLDPTEGGSLANIDADAPGESVNLLDSIQLNIRLKVSKKC